MVQGANMDYKKLASKAKQNVVELAKLKEKELKKKRYQKYIILCADAFYLFQYLTTKALFLSWDNDKNRYVTTDGDLCIPMPNRGEVNLDKYIKPKNLAGKWYKEIKLNKQISTGFKIDHYRSYQNMAHLFNFRWDFPEVNENRTYKKNDILIEKDMMKKDVYNYLCLLKKKLDVDIKLWYWASSKYEIWYRTVCTNGFRFQIDLK